MKRGDIVEVTFDDHVEDGSKPILFTVYGRVVRLSKRSVTICCWEYAKSRRQDDNVKTFTLVRSCIRNLQILSE